MSEVSITDVIRISAGPDGGQRVWILNQRIHHGPPGIVGGVTLIASGAMVLRWGLKDLHDKSLWFVRGPQYD